MHTESIDDIGHAHTFERTQVYRTTCSNGRGKKYGDHHSDREEAVAALRLILAATVLAVAFRMFLGLFYQPDEIYTLYPL